MVVDKFTINHEEIKESFRNLGMDLRKFARNVISDTADECLLQVQDTIHLNEKTGQMETEPFLSQSSSWEKTLHFGDSVWLDRGTRPHKMPLEDAKEMAPYYGMTTMQFWGIIKKYGTKSHPFINDFIEIDALDIMNRIANEEINMFNKTY